MQGQGQVVEPGKCCGKAHHLGNSRRTKRRDKRGGREAVGLGKAGKGVEHHQARQGRQAGAGARQGRGLSSRHQQREGQVGAGAGAGKGAQGSKARARA